MGVAEIAAGGKVEESSAVSKRMQELPKEGREYGGLVYRDRKGLYNTIISKYSGDPDFADIWLSIDSVLDGAMVTGTWHSHHDRLDPMFSSADWENNYQWAKNYNGNELSGKKIALEGIYLGGWQDGNIYYYRLGSYVHPPSSNSNLPVLAPTSGQLRPYTQIVGQW